VNDFLSVLRTQRWDDHRYYHQSRVNQSLHLVSAVSFLCAYVLLFIHPALAGLVGWLVSMASRQAGHFFFEPRGYDHVNQATHAHKEDIKVGYNLHRKRVLMALWVLSPVLLLATPTLFGTVSPARGWQDAAEHVGLIWLALGVAGLLFRTVHLFMLQGVGAGLAWAVKILTDPFHDIKLYHRSPLYLLRGQRLDPMQGHRAV
jgi:hypothetical protein